MNGENITPMVEENYPVDVVIPYPETSSRWLALMTILFMIPKLIILIPHIVAMWLLSFVSLVVWFLSQWAVLFTGRYPRGMFKFQVDMTRWSTRVNAYMMGLVDRYPPFSLDK